MCVNYNYHIMRHFKVLLATALFAVMPAVSSAQVAESLSASASSSSSGQQVIEASNIKNFSNAYLSYLGSYNNFGHGYYGLGYEFFDTSGLGCSVSFHGSWGLVDEGEFMTRFGLGYGYGITKWLGISGMVKGMIGSYTEVTVKPGKYKPIVSKNSKTGGGILFVPTIHIKAGPIALGVHFDLGWGYYGTSGFYKDLELTLGYHF